MIFIERGRLPTPFWRESSYPSVKGYEWNEDCFLLSYCSILKRSYTMLSLDNWLFSIRLSRIDICKYYIQKPVTKIKLWVIFNKYGYLYNRVYMIYINKQLYYNNLCTLPIFLFLKKRFIHQMIFTTKKLSTCWNQQVESLIT